MPSSLPFLHTACLHLILLFGIVIPTSFHIFKEMLFFFVLFLCLLLVTVFSEDRQLHAASRCQRTTRVNSTCFSRLWRKQLQKSTRDGEKHSLWRSTRLVPRRKAWERGDLVAMAVPRGCYVCACAQLNGIHSKAGARVSCFSLDENQ